MKIPEFETDRLYLRGVTLDDATSYQRNFSDYEVIRHLSHVTPWPYPENGAYEFMKHVILPEQGRSRWAWAIFLKKSKNEVIGVVDLWRDGKPENRGFWLAKKHWGKGIMTEAVKPIMDFAFNDLNFTKLIFANALGNTRSRRIKEKTGARLIRIEAAKFVDPQYSEREIWELTKEEWGMHKSTGKSNYTKNL